MISLQSFQEKMSYIRGLQSLGKRKDSYGNLFIPVEKLLDGIERNMWP